MISKTIFKGDLQIEPEKSPFSIVLNGVFFKQDSGADVFTLYLIHRVSQDDTWLR